MDFTSLVVIGNALVLGVRHGVDWDHIAAIADIVGTAGTTKVSNGSLVIAKPADALRLSWYYALGHASIVLVLGIIALKFAAVLPEGIDPFMEKAVGTTLLLLGGWILYSLGINAARGEDLKLQSRWMVLLSKIRKLTGKSREPIIRQYTTPAAFGVGVIHGFGAETGTQVLLIAAVGGSASHSLGVTIVLAFISGLLLSNTLVALITCAGFMNSARFKPLFIAASIITGIFSLIIGAMFVGGYAEMLPNLQS
jgi:high-affinity nickel permease